MSGRVSPQTLIAILETSLLSKKSRISPALFFLAWRNFLSTQPHGHDDVEEGAVDLEDPGAELVNQLEEDFVLAQRVERVNEIARVEGDGDFLAFVVNRKRFARLADFR